MNLDNLNKSLTLFANVGVLAGIIFLAIEINQNTSVLRSEAYQNRADDLYQMYSMITESDTLNSGLSKMEWGRNFCTPDPDLIANLSEEERTAIIAYLRANWFRFDNANFQYLEGTLDAEYFERGMLPAIANYVAWWDIFEIPQARQAMTILERHSYDLSQRPCLL